MKSDQGEAMKAIIYLRVSTEEQGESGLGLSSGETSAREYCERQGIEVLEIVREVKSGKNTTKRPLLNASIDRCKAGEAQLLISPNVSRLARSVIDLCKMQETAKASGFRILLLDNPELDLNTPNGKMVFQFLGVMAEWEREIISDRTKKALSAKKARGEKVGRTSTLAPETVATIRSLRKDNASLPSIATTLNENGIATGQGGAKWYPSSVRKVLLATGGDCIATPSKHSRKVA
jgi:DNA invertase Pin-like site-specific DNA recombinase